MLRPYTLLTTTSASIFLMLSIVSVPAHAEIAVVVHPGNDINSLNAHEVKLIFLKKSKRFPDGNSAKPVNQKEDLPIYDQFAQSVLGRNASQMTAYWSGKIFSGKATPPAEVGGDEAMKRKIASVPDAIGYINSENVDRTVKVVYTIP